MKTTVLIIAAVIAIGVVCLPAAPPQKTKLDAELVVEIQTNWVTTSREIPEGGLWYPATLHQTGHVISNIVARIDWNGGVVNAVLESKEVDTVRRDMKERNEINVNAASGKLIR